MLLRISSIHKKFKENLVLNGATFEFSSGKIYGLLGRNGAGKTTLFNIIYKEILQDSGTIEISEDGKLYRPLNFEDVGMVFAEPNLPLFLTGYEYIKFVVDVSVPHFSGKIDDYFDYMEFSKEDRHKLIKEYSSGMKSKISLLTLYIQKPKVILLDEPLTAVDIVSSAEIKKFFKSLKLDHILILSTHITELARDLCEEIVILNNGILTPIENLEKNESFEVRILEAFKGEDNVWCYFYDNKKELLYWI